MKILNSIMEFLSIREIVGNEHGFIGTAAAIGAGVGALGGAVAGASDSTTTSESGIRLAKESRFERDLAGQQASSFKDFQEFVGAGPGLQDFTAGIEAQRSFADQIGAVQRTGFISPEGQQQARAQAGFTLAPQRLGLQQGFQQAQQSTAQLAAQLGRSADDPILQSRLLQQQIQSQQLLGAQEGALTQQFGQQQLGFAGQRAGVLGQLGNQAFQNRLSLLGTSGQLREQERQFRVQTGTRFGSQTEEGSFGKALSGGLTGAVSGAGAGQSFANLGAQQQLFQQQTGAVQDFRTQFANQQLSGATSSLGAMQGQGAFSNLIGPGGGTTSGFKLGTPTPTFSRGRNQGAF